MSKIIIFRGGDTRKPDTRRDFGDPSGGILIIRGPQMHHVLMAGSVAPGGSRLFVNRSSCTAGSGRGVDDR